MATGAQITAELKKRYPVYKDWSDEDILTNLSDPAKFKKAFPEYQTWTDDDVKANVLRAYGSQAGTPAGKPLPSKPAATIGPRRPGALERSIGAVRGITAGLFPEGSAAERAVAGPLTREGVAEATRRRNAPLLPEGGVQTAIGGLMRGGVSLTGVPARPSAFVEANLAYELHKRGLDKDKNVEQWIRNGIINTLWDLGDVADDTVRGLTTPNNLAMLAGLFLLPATGAPAVISRLVAAGFSYQQAEQAAQQLVHAYQLHLAGDDVAAGKEVANSVSSGVFSVLSGLGAGHESGVKGVLKDEWRAFFQREGHTERDAARMADLQVERSNDRPPEQPSMHISEQAVREAEQRQHAEQMGVPLPGHPEIRTGAPDVAAARTARRAARAAARVARRGPSPLPPFQAPPRIPLNPNLVQRVTGAWQGIRNLLNPAGQGPYARVAAGGMRQAMAEIAAADERARMTLNDYRADFDRLLRDDPQAGLTWINAYETGQLAGMPLRQRQLAGLWQGLQSTTWDAVRQRNGMHVFIDNYFPHLFKDPARASALFSRRPLEGPQSWRFKRKFPTLLDAIQWAQTQGVALEPLYENPVDYMTNKLHEMRKYIHFYDFVEQMKALGVLQFSPQARVPYGMAKIDDPIGTVYGAPYEKITMREAYDKLMFDGLNQFARSLGVDHVRQVQLPGVKKSVWGYTIQGVNRVWSRHGGPEEVLTHELGHQLHFRYPELDGLLRTTGLQDELRNLADLRYERQQTTAYYKRYVRKGTEKIANLIHAYVHMRERGRQVAPKTFARLDEIINAHPELSPLRELQPSLVLGTQDRIESLYVGKRIFGYYYAPEPAARVINNYLKPGLAGAPAYELFRYPANLLNQMQLGMGSAFHFNFTGLDTAVSMWSLGLQRLRRGEIVRGLGAIARGNIVTAPIESYIRGNRMLKEFYGSPQGQFYADAVNRLIAAGGRVKMENFYSNSSVEAFLRAWRRGEPAYVAANALPAAVEALAAPIMKQWVPRLKLGTFALLAEEELARAGPNAGLLEQRAALARAWDSVDNRLGQLVLDNLFWRRTFKDTGLIMVRSLGWNLGTFREIGGGMLDMGKFAASGGRSGISPRMAYTLALPVVIAIHGAMLGYLLGQPAHELLDYFYPRTGRKNADGSAERFALPSYTKDLVAYARPFRLGIGRGIRGIGTTFAHKTNPGLSMTLEMLRNRDFYGVQIRNEDDSVVKQTADMLAYMLRQGEPLWTRNVELRKQAEGEVTVRNVVESLFGITPAAKAITRTTAEALAADYIADKIGDRLKTKEEFQHAQQRGELIREFRVQDPKRWENLKNAMKERQISKYDFAAIMKAQRGMTPLQLMVESNEISPEQALNVYDRADENEKKELQRVLFKKRAQVIKQTGLKKEKRQELLNRFDQALRGAPKPAVEDLFEEEPLPERPELP